MRVQHATLGAWRPLEGSGIHIATLRDELAPEAGAGSSRSPPSLVALAVKTEAGARPRRRVAAHVHPRASPRPAADPSFAARNTAGVTIGRRPTFDANPHSHWKQIPVVNSNATGWPLRGIPACARTSA